LREDDRARVVWQYVQSLDLSALYSEIDAVEGGPGRPPVDPAILFALWMLATLEGIGSARELDRRCQRDLPYMWLCGGVGVNYHLLSDFRSRHPEVLDQLLTDTVATLMHQELVTLAVVAHDGMRVRAHAGSSSFRRQPTLEECRAQARAQVERLREEAEDSDGGHSRRDGARQRAAQERLERIEQALRELQELQAQREKKKAGSGAEARVSTSDPQARKMKMADGGFRPAYNVHFATDGDTRVIVAVNVTNDGSDRGEMSPMHAHVVERYGVTPQVYAVDCGFSTKEEITRVERKRSQVIAPIHGEKQMRQRGTDPYARQPEDSDEMFAFRQRMATEEAQALYRQRSSIAEFPNAQCRNHGLYQFRVRGLLKVRAVALWHALAFNFERLLDLSRKQTAAAALTSG
jgi:transposase